MMKIVSKRMIYMLLVVLWMIIIFGFSSQDGDKSQKTSNIITDSIVKLINNVSNDNVEKELQENVSFIVRKIAHFSAYLIGGILIFNLFNTFSLKIKYIIILTIIFGAVYAMSDEVHQYFVSDRSAQFRDVCIDTSGVAVATIIRYIMIKKHNMRKEK